MEAFTSFWLSFLWKVTKYSEQELADPLREPTCSISALAIADSNMAFQNTFRVNIKDL